MKHTTAPETIAILGATGSIGASTLDVLHRHPDKYRILALSGNRNWREMQNLCARFHPQFAVMADATAAKNLAAALPKQNSPKTQSKTQLQPQTKILSGADALTDLATAADTIVCGIVGAAGLRATLAAVRAGKKVLIANKEPLVMLGAHIMREARAHRATVIPLDSEHNAIFQCLPHQFFPTPNQTKATPQAQTKPQPNPAQTHGIQKILLTASGGPFRLLPLQDFPRVTPDQACAHPNWQMGRKVSVDSATMMNKGLELIEACALFALPERAIDIVIHPQSIIHSIVEYIDGSMLAQLSSPDMRVPIAHALGHPQRIASGAARLDLLTQARFDFTAPDPDRFPSLALAREAARIGGSLPAIMNAANEIAVEAFLQNALRFDKIPVVVERTMQQTQAESDCDLETILAVDHEARQRAAEHAAANTNATR